MRAFHGDPAIKATYLARVRAHRAADELIQGRYWREGRGGAVGCTVEKSVGAEAAYEDELGIPRQLAELEYRFFEGMSNGKAQEWPERFLLAIPVGADLGLVIEHFMVWMLEDVSQFAREDGKQAIVQVVALYQRRLAGEAIRDEEWRAA